MGKPPVNTSETNALQGMTVSKIDFYNLSDVVRKLRDANVSYIDIAKEINENHLPLDAPKVSTMSVHRWIKRNMDEDSIKDLRYKEEQAINIYKEECEILTLVNEQIQTLEILMDGFKNMVKTNSDVKIVSKDIKELMFSMEKMIARKGQLLVSLKATQSQIYNYANMTEIVNIILDMVKESNLVLYAEITEKIRENVMLSELFRKIKDK
jgi:hypothetical protein